MHARTFAMNCHLHHHYRPQTVTFIILVIQYQPFKLLLLIKVNFWSVLIFTYTKRLLILSLKIEHVLS